MVFQKAIDAESTPLLDFSFTTFWMQIHNIPPAFVTQETGETIGSTLGTVVQVADPEDDGTGGEFLRVRIKLDISRPLPRCCKLWNAGKLVGWVGLKFERLPNICYWCRRVGHGDRDCEVWLHSRGRLRREEQQYGEWLRADTFRPTRKTVAVIPGVARNQAPWLNQKQRRAHEHGTKVGTSSQSNYKTGSGFDKPEECTRAK